MSQTGGAGGGGQGEIKTSGTPGLTDAASWEGVRVQSVAVLDRESGNRSGCVQSLVRAFGLLDQLASHQDGLTLTEVAKLVGLPRSTAHRLLTTMQSMRYVVFDPTNCQWLVGSRALTFGGGFEAGQDIARLARPVMRSLLTNSRATVSISVPDEEEVFYVGQVRLHDDRHAIPHPGDRLPLHTTAAGKVMLAHWTDTRREASLGAVLAPRTPHSITDTAGLERELEAVRSRGYAVDDQESAAGVRCVATAVLDRRGHARAALSISGPILHMAEPRLAALGATLRFAAKRMTEDFGGAIAA
jgi:IclR family acetate operon transcriptional repressor